MRRSDISKLSDSELRGKLREHGIQPGPITATTRKVYEMQLQNLVNETRGGESKSDLVTSKLKRESPSLRCARMDTKNDRDPSAIIKFNLKRLKLLSNRELRHKFLSIGRVCGPLTETTRSVHEGLMAKLLLENEKPDLVFDQSFEESRIGYLAGNGTLEMPVESRPHSFEESRWNYFTDQVRETIIDIDSLDLRDIGRKEYDGVRTALALYDGQCQQRSKDYKYPSSPKKVKLIGFVRNMIVEAKYSSSQKHLLKKNLKHKEIFAYHATALENVPSIIRNNLDPTRPVAHGRRFGDGCYFSEYPEFSYNYGQDCMLMFKVLLVSGHYDRYKSDERGFCEQIIVKDPNLFKPVYVLYF